ncbi:MAG: hypothetical protein HOD92_04665 [Deltaproteobacteria bacterium]|jgi:hypothetical protein|nr:hypothetical protein [Deltaproteobacteria bacterium]
MKADGSEVLLLDAFNSIAKDYKMAYSDLVEMAFQIFEVASNYTASLNQSLNTILALFDCEKARSTALNSKKTDLTSSADIQVRLELLKTKLFDPINDALSSKENTTVESVIKKLSQDDIDSLFD